MRQRRLYPKVNRDYSWLPELVLRVQTDEGELEERRRVLMHRPLAVGMCVPFQGTRVAIEHVEEIGGSFYAIATA